MRRLTATARRATLSAMRRASPWIRAVGAIAVATAAAGFAGARVAAAAPAQASGTEVEAALDRGSVRLGETVVLYVRVRSSGVATPEIDDPEMGPLTIVRSEDRSAFRFSLPGGATREFYREYVLRADRAGDVLIPPITIRVGGETYETKPLRLSVVPTAAPEGLGPEMRPEAANEVAVRLSVEPETVYVGQQATLTVAVFFDASLRPQLRREPEFRAPELQGVWVTELPTPVQPERRAIDGREYFVQVFKRAVFPVDSGIVAVPPASVVYEVRRGLLYAPQTFEARSRAGRIVARPLPQAGRAPGFTGAVGVLSADAWLDRATLRVGEAANLTFEARGTGNVGGLIRPGLPELNGLRVYDAGESADPGEQALGWGGRKRFSWVLVPERIGRIVIPKIALDYFDPSAGAYRTASAGPLVLDIEAAAALPVAGDAGGLTLRYVKARPSRVRLVRLWDRPLFWGLQLVPPLAVFAVFFWSRRRGRAHVPSRRVLRRARLNGFERVRRQAADPETDLFGELRAFALQWLEQRLGAGALRSAGIVQLQHALEDGGVGPALAREVADFIEACARHRFAPEPLPENARAELLARAEDLLARVDREAGPRRRRSAARALVLALTLPWAAGSDGFADGVRAYASGDFEAAARAFEPEARAPRPDPHALYNLANAYYQMGLRGRATYLWLRAAALDPRDSDIRYNLRLVSGDDPVLQSALPAVPLARDELALAFAILWCLAAAAWIAHRLGHSGRARWFGAGLLAGALAAGAFLARVALGDPVAVTLTEDVALRGGPALQSETILELPAGTALHVKEVRDRWLLTDRPGVGQGWVNRSEAGVL